MSHLTHRAEQALLGALLALPELPPDLMAGLRSDDFGHRGHQQVFSAVLELREQQPWLKGDDRLTAVAARVSSPGADRQWLEELRDRAARPSHLGPTPPWSRKQPFAETWPCTPDALPGNRFCLTWRKPTQAEPGLRTAHGGASLHFRSAAVRRPG